MTSSNGAIIPVKDLQREGALALVRERELIPVPAPDLKTSEGFLRLTSHILLKAKREPFVSLGVISARTGEGKTTAALNLAICLGRTQGRAGRILLVDGDTRQRTLTRLLGGAEDDENGKVPHPILQVTHLKGVDLMTAPMRNGALTLHDPEAWAKTLDALSARYAMIVVDCPSVLESPEGLVLPACVDELVLVVRSGETSREAIQETVEGVEKDLLGVILNGADARKGAT
ncbi:MAG: CpsD/CapB family tyrosine-protein kinase [Planctomycetota bacterium]|jgi:Mrp family chromosome partitioning ATPase